jgi:hypothetical protein
MRVKKSIKSHDGGLKLYFLRSIDNTFKRVYVNIRTIIFGVTKMAKRETKNTIYSHDIHVVDRETGEVTQTTNETIVQFPAEPEYIKLYLDDLNRIYELPNNSILYEVMKRMDYDGLINLSKYAKDMICEKLGLKPQTFANYLQKLKEKDIIHPVGRGTFMPNPNLFGKGTWKEIYSRRKKYAEIKLNITYKPDGTKTVQTEFDLEE